MNSNIGKMKTPFNRFIDLLKGESSEVISIYFYSSLSGIIYLTLPLGVQSIVNLLFGGLVSTSLVVLIFMVVAGVFINGWLEIQQMEINERIQRKVFTKFAMRFAYKIPRLNLVAVDDYYLPELVNRFFDTSAVQKGLSKVLLEFPAAILQILFGIVLLSFYNPAFIVFGACLVLLVLLIIRLTYNQGMRTSMEESNYKYEVGYWLEEVARIIKSIKLMGTTNYPLKQTDQLVCGYLDARADHFSILKIQYWAFVVFKLLITASLLIIGSILVVKQQLNIGQFIAAEIVILLLLNSVQKLIGSLDVVYDMFTALEKVNKLLDLPEERTGTLNIHDLRKPGGIEIKTENLGYTFPNTQQPVFSNLNFEIKPGEKLCIFGTQGSGKSTLLKMFTGAFSGYNGKVLFNDYPLGDYDLNLLRQQIGIYLSTPDLFTGTLRNNLTLGDETIPTGFILQTCEAIGLLNYIQALPDGLNTNIDSLGKKLPRNTVNKILLTRALLKKPQLLLLEDCWSGLERIEQETIINFLTGNGCQCTLIVVTNDENFAKRCDKILLLDGHETVAFGNFEKVSASPAYRKMFKHLSL